MERCSDIRNAWQPTKAPFVTVTGKLVAEVRDYGDIHEAMRTRMVANAEGWESVNAIPFAHLQSGKIRRCCVDRLSTPP